MKTPQANLSSPSAFLIVSVELVRAWFLEYPLRKPNWWEKKNLFTWRKFNHLKKIPYWIISRFWLGHYLDYLLCFFPLNLLRLQCPLVELVKGKLCYRFHGQGRISEFFWLDNIFIYFTATLVKKILKQLEISLELAFIWRSIMRLEVDSSDFFFMFIIPLTVCHTSLRFFLLSSKVRTFCLSEWSRYDLNCFS